MSCLTLKRSLIVAVITSAAATSTYAADQVLSISGDLKNWRTWNASSKAPATANYQHAVAGIDLVQGVTVNQTTDTGYQNYLVIPVSGSITYDDTTCVSNVCSITALTLTQQGSFTGYYDINSPFDQDPEFGAVDKKTDGFDDGDPNHSKGGGITISGLKWTLNTGQAFLSQDDGFGTVVGCTSGEAQCAFTKDGVNANDHSNGIPQSIFDFQGITNNLQTNPKLNAGQTAYGNSSFKIWSAVPGVTGLSINITSGAVTLDVASQVSSGVASTNAANRAQFVLTASVPNGCTAGEYYDGTNCVDADPGYKVPANEATSQTACEAGTYQPSAGQSSCLDARAGKFAPVTALTIDVDCSPGSYQPNTGQSSCIEATAGNYVDSSGAIAQTACPDGTSSPAGATSLSQCAALDPDSDGDGFSDSADKCPSIADDQTDTDSDGQGDACDLTPNGDTDGDGVDNNDDNCPEISNADQKDYDADEQGNACDATPNVVLPIQSSGAQDGWLLESTETSKKGGKADVSSTTLIIGDSVKNQEYRSILQFNTATLPDNAVITKAILTLKKATGSKGDVKPLGNILVDLKQKNFGTSASLAIADFEALPGKTSVTTLKASGSNYTGVLSSTGVANISKTLATQFKIHFAKDDNNDKGDDYLKLFSGNAPSTSRPTLVIEYYVP